MIFLGERFKGSTLQAMGVAPRVDDEYSIVGGSGMFAMANGIVRRQMYKREAKLEIDRLTIKGLIPILNEMVNAKLSSNFHVLRHSTPCLDKLHNLNNYRLWRQEHRLLLSKDSHE